MKRYLLMRSLEHWRKHQGPCCPHPLPIVRFAALNRGPETGSRRGAAVALAMALSLI